MHYMFRKSEFSLYLLLVLFRRLLGKDLTDIGLQELEELEQQLNEGLLSIKERKVRHLSFSIFTYISFHQAKSPILYLDCNICLEF